jgi:hypothetical protein
MVRTSSAPCPEPPVGQTLVSVLFKDSKRLLLKRPALKFSAGCDPHLVVVARDAAKTIRDTPCNCHHANEFVTILRRRDHT